MCADSMVIGMWDWVWPIAIGGCHLGRPIEEILMLKSGKWEIVELEVAGEAWDLLPRVWGRLRKVKSE